MRKNITIIILLIGFSTLLRGQQAQQVSMAEALRVAQNHLANNYRQADTHDTSVLWKTNSAGNTILYEVAVGNRCVLLSGSKACIPILGEYSLRGGFLLEEYDSLPSNIKGVIEDYIQQIEMCFSNDTIRLYHQDEWQMAFTGNVQNTRDNDSVLPLLTTEWNQSGCNIGLALVMNTTPLLGAIVTIVMRGA